MKPRYFGWRPTTAMAKRFKDAGIPCMCPSCLKACPSRADMRTRLTAEIRAGLSGQRLAKGEP